MRGPIQSVEATCLIHATEDPAKVEKAMTGLLNTRIEPEVERLEGHFGNVILKASIHLTGDDAGKAFESIVSRMTSSIRNKVIADLDSHLDEHSAMFLRFDKQRLVRGSMALGSADSVRVKVKPRVFLVRGGVAKFYSGLIEGG